MKNGQNELVGPIILIGAGGIGIAFVIASWIIFGFAWILWVTLAVSVLSVVCGLLAVRQAQAED